jgi:hypothetical protein
MLIIELQPGGIGTWRCLNQKQFSAEERLQQSEQKVACVCGGMPRLPTSVPGLTMKQAIRLEGFIE